MKRKTSTVQPASLFEEIKPKATVCAQTLFDIPASNITIHKKVKDEVKPEINAMDISKLGIVNCDFGDYIRNKRSNQLPK